MTMCDLLSLVLWTHFVTALKTVGKRTRFPCVSVSIRRPIRTARTRSAFQHSAEFTPLTSTLCSRSMRTQERHGEFRGNPTPWSTPTLVLTLTHTQNERLSCLSYQCDFHFYQRTLRNFVSSFHIFKWCYYTDKSLRVEIADLIPCI